jgi:benzoyl-CoA reductase/2-hydroxyglutaryl-CoA dehydratase subunit BcrC/BadD/HgdB
MTALEKIDSFYKNRPSELVKLKQKGAKIVAYVPNGYMPEELVCASGAIPAGLNRGGDHEAVLASEAYLFRLLDTYCRAQIGYRALGKELVYQMPDLLVVPITDRNITAIADSWELSSGVDVFKYGIPRYKGVQHAFDYYLEGLNLLKQRLEKLTGNEITDSRLKAEAELTNKINQNFEEISLARKLLQPGISGKDFIKLNHASYYLDRQVFLSALESVLQEVNEGEYRQKATARIMLVGSTLAEGDNKVIDLLESSGANIVIEEFSEGIRPHAGTIETGGEMMKNLAEAYLEKRIPPAVFHNAIEERFSHLLKLIKEFKVEGVVWYSLLYRDCYDREGLLFLKVLEKETGIPFLKIVSDYDSAETGQMRTRIETFLEIVKQGR